MDTVRRQERREHAELKGQRYTFLRNPASLSQSAKDKLQDLVELYPVLGKAYRLKTLFADLWTMPETGHQLRRSWTTGWHRSTSA
jgi:transposase